MNEILYLGMIVALIAYVLYRRITGCTGCHVWGSYKETGRIRTSPFKHTDDVKVEKEVQTTCQRENCNSTDSKWETIGSRVRAAPLLDVIRSVSSELEPRYQCTRCDEIATSSEWELVSHPIRGGVRFERQCPECGTPSISDSENRLDTSLDIDIHVTRNE